MGAADIDKKWENIDIEIFSSTFCQTKEVYATIRGFEICLYMIGVILYVLLTDSNLP